MNQYVPCRVSLDTKAYHGRKPAPFSSDDLALAREELTEKLLKGDKVSGVDLEGLIDCAISDNYSAFLRYLYEQFANIGERDAAVACAQGAARMRLLVDAHLNQHPEVIEERAAELARSRIEEPE